MHAHEPPPSSATIHPPDRRKPRRGRLEIGLGTRTARLGDLPAWLATGTGRLRGAPRLEAPGAALHRSLPAWLRYAGTHTRVALTILLTAAGLVGVTAASDEPAADAEHDLRALTRHTAAHNLDENGGEVYALSASGAVPGEPDGLPRVPAAEQARSDADTERGARFAEAPPPSPEVSAQGRKFLDALEIPYGQAVDAADLVVAAHALDVNPRSTVDEDDLELMRAAYRQRAEKALVGLGLPFGSSVDDDDIRHAAAVVGVDPGANVDPADVDNVVRAAVNFPGGPTPVFAVTAGVNLRVPSRVPEMIGFHQAAYAGGTRLLDVAHPSNLLLPSRGRATHRTSAADVRVPPGTTVLSPVRGTVVEVTPYALYGKYPDWRIRMIPDANPNVLVSILHVSDPVVGVGWHLEAGDPVALRSTQFPFESQIDRFAGRGPHVHVEARPR